MAKIFRKILDPKWTQEKKSKDPKPNLSKIKNPETQPMW